MEGAMSAGSRRAVLHVRKCLMTEVDTVGTEALANSVEISTQLQRSDTRVFCDRKFMICSNYKF